MTPAGAKGREDGFLVLEARPGEAKLRGVDKLPTKIWSYQGMSPGPEIRVKQDELVKVRLVNKLPQPTTIHWHGLRSDNAMDGVPGLTQKPVPPGASFDYVFRAPDAGTFWYHSHERTWEQVARGLYGALIVEEKTSPGFDRDLLMVIDDWRLDNDGQIHEESLGHMGEMSHGGRLGNWPTVNGQYRPAYTVGKNERLRLRLVNCCNARTLNLILGNWKASVIAIDGQPATHIGATRKLITLASAQRVDLDINVEGSPGETVFLDEVSQDFPVPLTSLNIAEGEAKLPHRREPINLPPNPLPDALPLDNVERYEMVMEGGAMGGMRNATYKGENMDIRQLVGAGQVWAFNGQVGMTEKPLFDVKKGQTVIVDLINRTAWPHPMHMHGHHFKVVRRNDKPVNDAPWRDTELVRRNEKVSIAFVADNPGKWALHCHILSHAASGMFTWFNVSA